MPQRSGTVCRRSVSWRKNASATATAPTHPIHAHEDFPRVNDIPPERFVFSMQVPGMLLFHLHGTAENVIVEVHVVPAYPAIKPIQNVAALLMSPMMGAPP
jgi:kynurenine formamidase